MPFRLSSFLNTPSPSGDARSPGNATHRPANATPGGSAGAGTAQARQASGALAGLSQRAPQPRRPKGEPNGMVGRMMAGQLFGSESERRTLEPHDETRLRVGEATGSIQPVSVQGEAGELAGHLYKAHDGGSTGKVALVLSGSGAPAEALTPDIAAAYQRAGVDVLSMNYRGFGASAGTPSEQGLYHDAEAMLDHVTNTMHVPAENVVVHGYSMGGPVAAHLTAKAQSEGKQLGGLVLDRPMPSTTKGVRAHHPHAGALPGQIAKRTVGTLSVEKNLRGQAADTKVVMLTDNEGLGREGEQLRQRLAAQGFAVSGGSTGAEHEDSFSAMHQQFPAIEQALLRPGQAASGQTSGQTSGQASTAPAPSAPATARTEEEQFQHDFGYLSGMIRA
ncbi:MAG: alpha/beta fold hydrolase [Burkholderia gladioli]